MPLICMHACMTGNSLTTGKGLGVKGLPGRGDVNGEDVGVNLGRVATRD